MATVSVIKGYNVLSLNVSKRENPHYIYFKKHTSQVQGSNKKSSGNSIFLYNLPFKTTLPVLKKFFQTVAIGATLESFVPSLIADSEEDEWVDLTSLTSDLELSRPPKDGAKLPPNCGIANFVDQSSFKLAFNSLKKLSDSFEQVDWPLSTIIEFGSSYFLSSYREMILDTPALFAEVSQALVDFGNAEQQSKEEIQRQTQLVDEDGFTLVVGSHRKTKAGILGKQKLAATVETVKAKSKLKKKEKDDFYRFQLRERKKEEMNELLHKFKLDQEKVRLMKEKKKFKPYIS